MLGIVLVLLASLAWGVAPLFSRKGLQYISPRAGSFIAVGSAFLLSALVGLVFHWRELLSLSLFAIGWFALTGIVSNGLANYFYYRGIHLVGASRASPVAASTPLLALPLAAIFLGEVITIPAAAGALGVVLGLYLITSGEAPGVKSKKRGYIFALLAALCWSAANLLIRRGVTTLAPPLASAPISLFFASLILIPPPETLSSLPKAGRKLWLIVVAGLCSGSGTLLFYSAMSLAPVVIVSPLGNLGPLVTILGSHLFLRRLEKVTPRLVGGALLVLAGAATVTIGRALG
ncbi:MAG: hypothetical protein HW414_1235 [Dehalococcoidia bacterium]|nr:hypothetical protein [Dehalococcoidia bacterium]